MRSMSWVSKENDAFWANRLYQLIADSRMKINVVSVENMADISIEVNEINVVSVERTTKG